MTQNRQHWQQVPPTDHPAEGLPRPITMLVRSIQGQTKISRHRHDWGQLVYASEGVISVTTSEGSYLVPPQRAVWVPPRLEHGVGSLKGAQLASVYIEAQEARELPAQCCVLEVTTLLQSLILEAITVEQQYPWQSAAGRLFRTLRDRIAVAQAVPLHLPWPEDPRLQTICSQLQLNPADSRPLEQWGQLVGASSRTLTRLFQRQTGIGFSQWRQQLRLQQAIQYLAEGQTVTTTAMTLGYDSASAFIHMFQKQLGVTPGEYFRSRLAGGTEF